MSEHAFPTRIAYAEALAIVRHVAAGRRLPNEPVPLSRAHGRVLAEALVAGVAMPPFDNEGAQRVQQGSVRENEGDRDVMEGERLGPIANGEIGEQRDRKRRYGDDAYRKQ